jgi:hypothetical protein
MSRLCATCATPLRPYGKQRFCSNECREAAIPTRPCEHCAAPFKLKYTKPARFCSLACRGAAATARAWETVECQNCRKPFLGKVWDKRKHCSTRCATTRRYRLEIGPAEERTKNGFSE